MDLGTTASATYDLLVICNSRMMNCSSLANIIIWSIQHSRLRRPRHDRLSKGAKKGRVMSQPNAHEVGSRTGLVGTNRKVQ